MDTNRQTAGFEANGHYSGPARCKEELVEAFQLVHDNYVERGYMAPHPSRMRYSIFELLPYSSTFVVRDGGMVTGTISMIEDSFCGLPIAGIFPERLDELRAAGKTVAEASMFACRRGAGYANASELVAWVMAWCCVYSCHRLCIVVNPRHQEVWQKGFGFKATAGQRSCGHVKGHPGVFLELDAEAIMTGREQPSEMLARTMKSPINPAALVEEYMLEEEGLMKLLSWRPEIAAKMTRHQRAVLERFYPMAMADVPGESRLRAAR